MTVQYQRIAAHRPGQWQYPRDSRLSGRAAYHYSRLVRAAVSLGVHIALILKYGELIPTFLSTASMAKYVFCKYSKTCLKRNAIVPVFFFVFTGFRFTKGCVLIKQSTKNMIA